MTFNKSVTTEWHTQATNVTCCTAVSLLAWGLFILTDIHQSVLVLAMFDFIFLQIDFLTLEKRQVQQRSCFHGAVLRKNETMKQ